MTLGKGHIFFTLALIACVVTAGCGGGASSSATGSATGAVVLKSAVLNGSEAVPPASTEAAGTGILEVNTTTGAVSGRLTITSAPTSTVFSVHVHEGMRGTSGHIVINLVNDGNGAWTVRPGTVINPARRRAFDSGSLYFDVHTFANPVCEIRGQIEQ